MTTINPLVAAKLDGPTDIWAGVWIAEDIELIAQGVKNGSWIDGTLGVVGATLDGLALISDPFGSLLQYGAAWLMEHVKPLRDALDWLAGDPAAIGAQAQTWRNVASRLQTDVTQLAGSVRTDVASWEGTAADAYRGWAQEQQNALSGLGKAAETMATITEAAGFLVATVRLMVRDAIATAVSRLISYVAEEAFSLGLATPLVLEQVTTTVAAWAARIARWLRDLVSSLRRLMPILRRLGELVGELKKILSRLLGGGRRPKGPRPPTRKELLDELARQGIKHNPADIVKIGKDASGKIVFLENGNAKAGLQHILGEHADDFARKGVPEGKIADLVFDAVTKGKIVGTQGKSRSIYEIMFEGKLYKIAISVGNNGFIVGANPVKG